jgi:predicted nucleic acid-binding protein
MYLLDTNVWLERLLSQAKANDVGKLLSKIPSDQLSISDFSFHSICVILGRLRSTSALLDFVQDAFVTGGVGVMSLRPEDTTEAVSAMNSFNLDFDDAYQYVIAEQNNLILVSFDDDFDGTSRGRQTPSEILST